MIYEHVLQGQGAIKKLIHPVRTIGINPMFTNYIESAQDYIWLNKIFSSKVEALAPTVICLLIAGIILVFHLVNFLGEHHTLPYFTN